MTYINPLEILTLAEFPVNEIDNTVIKKAKRKLFSEIDLSDDGFIEYSGLKLSKSDCEKAIEDLENISTMAFYSYLSENQFLNNFLLNGDESFFIITATKASIITQALLIL